MVFALWVYISYGLICLISYLYTPNLLLVIDIMAVGYVLKPCSHASLRDGEMEMVSALSHPE